MNHFYKGLLLIVFFLGGCSTLFTESTVKEPGFSTQMVPVKDARPLPVEIAADIASLTEEGAIVLRPESVETEEDLPEKYLQSTREELRPENQNSVDVLVTQGPLGKFKEAKGPLGFSRKRRPANRADRILYKVKLGDTLMEISFEKHGDYLRWKEIYSDNRNKMSHYTKMPVGTILTINNVNYVLIRRKGQPYLIRKGDTLKSIAEKVYGSPSKWVQIWKNNPQLIRNPKKLYAGFTLYYQPESSNQKMRVPSNAPVNQ